MYDSKYDLIIFDADGTLRRCTVPGQPCPNNPDEWEWIDEAYDWLDRRRDIVDAGLWIGIASNQAGIEYGFLNAVVAADMLLELYRNGLGQDPIPGAIQMCPFKDKAHPDRKPNPGMLNKIMAVYGVSPEKTLMVGDMVSDQDAAANAGCDFEWADEFFGFKK